MFCAVNTFPPFMLGCSVHNAYSVTQCASLRHCSHFRETTRKKTNFSPYFWLGISHKNQGCTKTKWPFYVSWSPSSTYCQLDVGSFTTTTQINLKLSFRCYLFPKCHFHREVLLQAAEMPFSSLLPCFSLPTIYLNNYYLSGIGLLVVGNCTINFKGQFLGLDT